MLDYALGWDETYLDSLVSRSIRVMIVFNQYLTLWVYYWPSGWLGQVTYQSVKWDNLVISLKTITWLSVTLTTAGFGFVQCCYRMLLLPSFLTFGLFCNRKLCHFFNWQGLVQHLQPQGSELEFKTPLFTGHSFLCPEIWGRATEDVECFAPCLAAVSCPHYTRTLERFAASKQPSKLWQIGEVVGSKLARVCPSVLVCLSGGESRSAGSITRSHSA